MTRRFPEKNLRGSALLTVLLLSLLGSVILAALLVSVKGFSRSTNSEKRVLAGDASIQEGLAETILWLRENAEDLKRPFMSTQFYSQFDRSAPTIGANDTTVFGNYTLVKLRATTDSVLLTNDSVLGTSNFPSLGTTNLTTSFSQAIDSTRSVRVSLYEALAASSGGDSGDPDDGNPLPTTNFEPVFRIDVYESPFQGRQVTAFVQGSYSGSSPQFLGVNSVNVSRDCDGYDSQSGSYSVSNRTASCAVHSQGSLTISNSNTVYGSAKSNGTLVSGGGVCGDFESPCAPGETCNGTQCGVGGLEAYKLFSEYCPQAVGYLKIRNDTTLDPASDDPRERCWRKIKIEKNSTLTLVNTSIPYFVEDLEIDKGFIQVVPSTPTGAVTFYLWEVRDDALSAEDLRNSYSPPNLQLHYLGTDRLRINTMSSPTFQGFLFSPNAEIEIRGNGDFHGGAKAKDLNLNGSGWLHGDNQVPDSGGTKMSFEVLERLESTR